MGYMTLAGLWGSDAPCTNKRPISIDLSLKYRCIPKFLLSLLSTAPSTPYVSPASDRNTIPHLPIELISKIISHAAEDADDKTDIRILLSSALVCRAWSYHAQSLLFRSVTLRSEKSCSAFLDAITDAQRGAVLANSVHSLRVVMNSEQPGCLQPQSFARTAALCPRLTSLDVSIYRPSSPSTDGSRTDDTPSAFDAPILTLLKSCAQLTSLTFANWASASSTELFQLLSAFPALTSLSLRGAPPALPSALASAAYPGALHTLSLNLAPDPSPALLTFLLTNAVGSLRALHCARQPDAALLDALLHAHGTHLEALALPTLPTRSLPATRTFFAHLPALRSLEVADAWSCAAAFRRGVGLLPAGLEDVVLGVEELTPLAPVIAFVRSEACALRCVTLVLWDGGEAHPLIPGLLEACGEKGVSVRAVDALRTVTH